MSLRLLVGAILVSTASAQAPADYYTSVDSATPVSLRSTLHQVIDDHTRFPYSGRTTDTWDILESADEDPSNAANIVDVYRNASYPKFGRGNDFYNREHLWPKSYGFPKDGVSNYPYTDCHMLMLCDGGFNSARSNKPFRFCDVSCSEQSTEVTNGMGGGSEVYPGNSNWTSGRYSAGTWEVWGQRRGDVARAMFYMDLRYEGGQHGTTGHAEPDLILTEDEALIEASRTGSNESTGYMGMQSVLLEWHHQDPVTDLERRRNDVVFGHQGNRNPFVDHPEWIDVLFDPDYEARTVPSAPTALVAFEGESLVALFWSDNPETNITGYDVWRSTVAGGAYEKLNAQSLTSSNYVDFPLINGTTYHYVVTATDAEGRVSGWSVEVLGTPKEIQ
jgi:endonuclease I